MDSHLRGASVAYGSIKISVLIDICSPTFQIPDDMLWYLSQIGVLLRNSSMAGLYVKINGYIIYLYVDKFTSIDIIIYRIDGSMFTY